jgi:hypothetical protein
MSPLLTKLTSAISQMRSRGATNGQIGDFVREALYSPLLEAAVAATPTPIDDLVLAGLKMLFPPAS